MTMDRRSFDLEVIGLGAVDVPELPAAVRVAFRGMLGRDRLPGDDRR
jgi:hypothetical protein